MRGLRANPILLTGLLIAMAVVLQGCPSLIANRPPNAEFTATPTSGEAPLTVDFDASASSDPDKDDPDGKIVSYEWDFGDGSTATGKKVTHTYSNDGMFTVTLTVTDGQGATDTASTEIVVGNPGPDASFTISPSDPLTQETVTFDASGSVDPAGLDVNAQDIVSRKWTLGDGTTGSGETVTHSYADDGDFDVTLTVTDDDGATDSETKTVSVQNRSPDASISASVGSSGVSSAALPISGNAPLAVEFDGSDSSDPDGTIQSFNWDFGDGNPGSGKRPSHTYDSEGDFTATLTVTDDDGATDKATATIDVMPASQVGCNSGPLPGSSCIFNNVQAFDGQSFSHISFDPSNERSPSDIVAKFDNVASFTMSGGGAAIRHTSQHYTNFPGEGTEGGPVSGAWRIDWGYFDFSKVTIVFETPVDAVGIFVGGDNPDVCGLGTCIKPTFQDGSTTSATISKFNLLGVPNGAGGCDAINGFMGVDSNGGPLITKARFVQGHGATSIDSIYFGKAVTDEGRSLEGPTKFPESALPSGTCQESPPTLP